MIEKYFPIELFNNALLPYTLTESVTLSYMLSHEGFVYKNQLCYSLMPPARSANHSARYFSCCQEQQANSLYSKKLLFITIWNSMLEEFFRIYIFTIFPVLQKLDNCHIKRGTCLLCVVIAVGCCWNSLSLAYCKMISNGALSPAWERKTWQISCRIHEVGCEQSYKRTGEWIIFIFLYFGSWSIIVKEDRGIFRRDGHECFGLFGYVIIWYACIPKHWFNSQISDKWLQSVRFGMEVECRMYTSISKNAIYEESFSR